jgi:hypothetical protein
MTRLIGENCEQVVITLNFHSQSGQVFYLKATTIILTCIEIHVKSTIRCQLDVSDLRALYLLLNIHE